MAIKINGITVIDDSRAGNLASAEATGNITGGNIITGGLVSAVGNISGNFILGNGSQLTGIDATSIQNGTANVRAFDSANVTVSAAGNANVGVFTGSGLTVTGSIEATNGFIGLDATSIANGTANVRTFEDANVTVSAGGNSNVMTVTGTGANITGTLSASGNLVAGNLIVTGIEAVTTLNVSGDTLISGNLTVSGNTITANVATIVITDPILGLGRGANGDPLTSNDGLDRGTEMFYFTDAEQIAFMGFDNNEGKMISASNVSIASNIVTVNSFGTTVVGTLEATIVTATGNVTGGNLITAGLVSLSSIVKTGSNGVGNIGSSSNTFDTIFAQATSAQYADLAEMYEADTKIEPGTVVAFGGVREVTMSLVSSDTRIAGVISTNPSYIMNSAQTGEHAVAVALTGRVPTRVTGMIRKGDMMVSAGDGTACACAAPQLGTVIGKALEDHDGESGMIEVVVGRV